jgi:succinate-semialdehyde dehydrogenase/glutarate-semialdehyde dehydrogenase
MSITPKPDDLVAVDPATGREIARHPRHDAAAIESALHRAEVAWPQWRATDLALRAGLLRRAATLLRTEAEALARLMAAEMGKPLAEGRAEAEKCAWVCEHYAEHGPAFLSDEPAATDASRSYVCYRPLGLVLAVMSWNFPLWQVFRFAAPALMAGNVGLLKHASNVPGCALAIQDLWARAGAPPGVFGTLLVGSETVADLVADRRVAAVTLTGSTPAGRAVAAAAGRHLKPTVLELGGSDPYIVLEDADLDAAATACVTSRLLNSGQSCIAAKRFVVVRSVLEDFSALVVERMAGAVLGHPCDEGTTVGPMARFDLRDELHAQVRRSLDAGARLLLGGELPGGDATGGQGAFYPPTVLTDVRPGMPAYDEELFGPVAALIAAEDEADAIRIANDTSFGLGAAVFTRDVARGERVARDQLQAGACFVNAFVKSDPRLPFGGIKDSGYGRELARQGIRAFVNTKTVYVA